MWIHHTLIWLNKFCIEALKLCWGPNYVDIICGLTYMNVHIYNITAVIFWLVLWIPVFALDRKGRSWFDINMHILVILHYLPLASHVRWYGRTATYILQDHKASCRAFMINSNQAQQISTLYLTLLILTQHWYHNIMCMCRFVHWGTIFHEYQ